MTIPRRDQKLIFKYLTENPQGLRFNNILKPPPKPVKEGNTVSLKSIREVQAAEDALFEHWTALINKGLIRPVDQLNQDWFVLTDKGQRIAQQDDFDLDKACLDIGGLINDAKLRSLVLADFDDQRYEAAVFNAYKHLEERVRAKASLSSNDVGATLMAKAFRPQHGLLRVASCRTPSEEESIFLLFKGAIQLFKNPSSHRTVDWSDSVKAAQAILFADLLLGFLGQAVLR
jgi:uncharacterized protein (TIGR02391 family)